jgi:acyl carrier protein
VAPDADLDGLAPDADLRETLELDSLDFLQVIELLSERAGVRIDEEDYQFLATLGGAATWLAGVAPAPAHG